MAVVISCVDAIIVLVVVAVGGESFSGCNAAETAVAVAASAVRP